MAEFPLPQDCSLDNIFLEQVTVGELELFMVGLVAAGAALASVTGSAADTDGFPVDRAYFELLERLSIVLARASRSSVWLCDASGRRLRRAAIGRVFTVDPEPESVRASLSSGVALQRSWPAARRAALCELIERDRVLRSFAGEFSPTALPLGVRERALARRLRAHYRLEAYTFEPPNSLLRHVTAGVFLFPRQLERPLCYGFAAADGGKPATARANALRGATREALQRLAFLWGEPLPSSPPVPAPTADFHQEHYLYPPHHEELCHWLSGRGILPRMTTNTFDGDAASFVDLTPPTLQERLVVCRATARFARKLRFGMSQDERARGKFPHPIA